MAVRLIVLALSALIVVGAAAAAKPPASNVCSRIAAGDGSARYRSVTALLQALQPGETGCLAAGTYREDIAINRGGRPGQPITLRAVPGARATIVGRFDVSRAATDLVVSYLRLDGSTTGGAPSPQINGSRIAFRYNDVTNRHTGICFVLGGGFERYGKAVAIVIDHNRIHGCGRLPRTNHDHAVYVEGSVGARVTNNVIYDIADYGVHLYPDADGTLVSHNVIVGTGGGIIVAGESSGGEYGAGHSSDNNTIALNVIANQSGHSIETYWGGPVGTGNTALRNCVWKAADGAIGETAGLRVSGTVTADPRFVAPSRGDYRLGAGSRCAALGAGPR